MNKIGKLYLTLTGLPFCLAGSNLISHLDNKFTIISSYFKVSLPVDNNLDVWTSIGISKIDSKEDYYVYVTSNDTYIPIKEILFDTGFTYGVGIDYKMKNGFFAGSTSQAGSVNTSGGSIVAWVWKGGGLLN